MNDRRRNDLPDLGRARLAALVAGLAGAAACAAGALLDPAQFFRAYLTAYIFWVGITLGCLALLMTYYVAGGAWGAVTQRFFAAGASTVWLMALAFLPVAAGLGYLYPWARPDEVAHAALLQYKAPYLNVPFFLARAAAYFLIWGGVTLLFGRWARGRAADPRYDARLRTWSGPALVLFALSVTFALVDWAMSLEPEWYSTIYAAMVAMGGLLAAFALVILAVALLARQRPFAGALSPRLFNDLGSLLLAFVMIWAYLAFSQYLLVWAGDLSEEIPWYLRRLHGGWEWIIAAVVLLHFALPFGLLLSAGFKRTPRLLAAVAVLVLAMRYVDVYWLIVPSFYAGQFYLHWLNFAAPIALGGLWVAWFAGNLGRRPLLAVEDPRLQQHLAREQARVAEEAHEAG